MNFSSLTRRRRPATNLFDWAFGPQVRELVAEEHALKLSRSEFKLKASLKDHSFVTTRNQANRLAHIADRSYTVWRRTAAGPELQRLVARAFCGQWVMRARHVAWLGDEPQCQRCIDALSALIRANAAQDGGPA